jgi:hypothetical protein
MGEGLFSRDFILSGSLATPASIPPQSLSIKADYQMFTQA